MILHLDIETYSACDLAKCGLHVYAEHESTGIWCAAYAFDDEEPQLWVAGNEIAVRVTKHIRDGGEVWAHNAAFERNLINAVGQKYGWPKLGVKQMRCTMAMSHAQGLPGGLGRAAAAVGMPLRKDDVGRRIMLQLAVPMSLTPVGFMTPELFPALHESLRDYCMQDVRVERALGEKLMRLSDNEQKVWELDQAINDRGVGVDRKAVFHALQLVKLEGERLDKRMFHATGGAVGTVNQNAKLAAWMRENGVNTHSMAADFVKDALERADLKPVAREVLAIRQEASKSSTKKLMPMLLGCNRDGRMRGLFQYHGAFTGRWAGRRAQLHNMPRPKLDSATLAWLLNDPEARLTPAAAGLFDSPMNVVSDALRSMLVAAPGNEFVSADLSQIEARVLPWLAGEQKVLDVFAGHGKVYEAAAAGIYHVPLEAITKGDPRRQVGKVACIAEGQLVLTDTGLVPIEKITTLHRVWDGVEWVSHDGAVLQGEKECITYDGLEATEDHQVWSEDGRKIPFGACAREQVPLLQTGPGRPAVRAGCGAEREREAGRGIPASVGPVRRVRRGKMDLARQRHQSENARVPELLADRASAVSVAASEALRRESPLSELQRSALCRLRRTRSQVRVARREIGGVVRADQFGLAGKGLPDAGDRSKRQFGKLRAGEPAFLLPSGQPDKSAEHGRDVFGGPKRAARSRRARVSSPAPRGPVLGRDAAAAFGRGDGGSDPREVGQPFVQTKRRVWDILNAGPRHRFTVSGRLVSNCLALGYGGGWKSFVSMGKNYGIKVPKKEAQGIVKAWRKAHPNITKFWRLLEEAAILAVKSPGSKYSVGRISYRKVGSFLLCKLPSGRVIVYPYPRVEILPEKILDDVDDDGKPVVIPEREGLTYQVVHEEGGEWARKETYGGSLAENVTQATARCVLSDAMLRIAEKGYQIVLHVHDEVVVEVPLGIPGILKRINELMATRPAWAEGLPIASEGWQATRYKK